MREYNFTLINPEFKNLQVALDPDQIKRLLEDRLNSYWADNIVLDSINATRAYIRPDKSILIQYQVIIIDLHNSRKSGLYLFGHLPVSSENYVNSNIYSNSRTLFIEDLEMAVPVFPYDPRLSALQRFTSTRDIAGIIAPVLRFSGRPEEIITDISYEILGYRLSSRCVISYEISLRKPSGGGDEVKNIIAKFYRPKRSARAVQSIEFLRSNGFDGTSQNKITVTNLLAGGSEDNVLFIEPGPGKPLHSLLPETIFIDGCAAAASIMNKLHSLTSDRLAAYTYRDELNNLREKAALLGDVLPGLREPMNYYLKLLEGKSRLVDTPANYRVSHRDFYDKQIIYSENLTTLIDCDNMSMADPALDYANFLAHLNLRRLQYPETAGNIGAGLDVFSETAKYPDKGFLDRVKWWKSATQLRLLMLYSLRPLWQGIIPEILIEMEKTWQD